MITVVGGSKPGKSITGLKRVKGYYAMVCACRVIDEKKYYGAYSSKVKVRVKQGKESMSDIALWCV